MTSLRLLLVPLIAISSWSFAQSPFEKELKDLSSTRNKAIDASTKLIDASYQKALDSLLKRAGAAGDVDAAVKIKAALDILPKAAEKTLLGEWDLRTTTNFTATVTIFPKGRAQTSFGGDCQWKIIGRTLYLGNLESGPDRYELPVKDGRLTGSNILGNGITLTRKPQPAVPDETRRTLDAIRRTMPETITPLSKEQLAKRVPHSYAFDYDFEPQPGKRIWRRIDSQTWHEVYPDGMTTVFKVLGHTRVEDTEGTIVVKWSGDEEKTGATNGGGLQAFIPDLGSEVMHHWYRNTGRGDTDWNDLAPMQDVK